MRVTINMIKSKVKGFFLINIFTLGWLFFPTGLVLSSNGEKCFCLDISTDKFEEVTTIASQENCTDVEAEKVKPTYSLCTWELPEKPVPEKTTSEVSADKSKNSTNGGGECGIDKVCLTNPLKDGTDIPTLIGNIIKRVLGILGSITLAVFVYGGFLWLTSAGNAEKVKKGTETMAWAAIGVFIIFSAYAILSTIIKGITG